MSLTASFTAQSVSGYPNKIIFTDTSSGSDGTITQRRVYAVTDIGTFLVEEGVTTEYSEWDYADATITLALLSKDYALRLTVQWLDVNNVVVEDATIDAIGFTEFNENFDYQTTQLITSNNKLTDDNNFWYNKTKLRTLIDAGNQAITRDSDLYNAQLCYDTATALRIGSQYNFNGNS